MISKQVQDLIDQVRDTKNIMTASRDGLGSLVQMAESLKNRVADLQSKLDAGGISADDLAGVAQATTDLHATTIELQAAIPAGVSSSDPLDQQNGSGASTGAATTGSTDPDPTSGSAPLTGDNALLQDGPTVQQYVDAGYDPNSYPPPGYASKSTDAEIADAKTKLNDAAAAQADADAKAGSSDPSPAGGSADQTATVQTDATKT